MNITKRLLIIVLTISLSLSVCSSAGAEASITSEIISEKVSSIFDQELIKVLEKANSDDLIPVDIWFFETETVEQREKNVKSIVGVNKETIINSKANTVAQEKVDSYITTERSLYAKSQVEFYTSFQKEYSNIKRLQSTKDNKSLFLSQYAPVIRAELNPNEIQMLSKDNRIEKIYYSPEMEMSSETNVSIPLIRATYTRDTLGYTGAGIKIGLIEADGLPNRSNSYFTSSNIIYDPNVSLAYTTHANMVASIMVAKSTTIGGITYCGIVPNAKLYATYYTSGDYDDWRVRVEWLLSQGVNVINMSAGFKKATGGAYCTHEAWLDHIAINHSVHFVKSAGNNGEEITCPGMAYNIVTVGAINDNNTFNHYNHTLWSDSSHEENSGLTNKPDLMAPGASIKTPDGTASGTSLAAPHVTAIVAQLCQRSATLKVLQDGVKAILTASIYHDYLNFVPGEAGYNEFGAGVVDSQASFYTANHARYITSNFAANSGNGAEKTYTFNVSSTDETIRVSLSWLKYSTVSGTHTSATPSNYALADLDLYVYDSNGNPVGTSNTTYNNTEIIHFIPTTSGTYTIKVKQYNQSPRTVFFGLAWY